MALTQNPLRERRLKVSGTYEKEYLASISKPEEFWGRAAQEIQWYKPYHKVLDDSQKPFYRWFVGGELNTCYNAVDYHGRTGRGEQLALIYDSPVTNTIEKFTYRELLDLVSKFAGGLRSLGVEKGASRVKN